MRSEEDSEDVKDGRAISEGIGSEFWKALEKRLRRALELRKQIVLTPLHSIPEGDMPSGDFVARAAQLEHIKGAVIGLQLALDLPARMIAAMEQVIASEKDSPDDDGDE